MSDVHLCPVCGDTVEWCKDWKLVVSAWKAAERRSRRTPEEIVQAWEDMGKKGAINASL